MSKSIEITRELEQLLEDYEWYNTEYSARQIANYIQEEVKRVKNEEE